MCRVRCMANLKHHRIRNIEPGGSRLAIENPSGLDFCAHSQGRHPVWEITFRATKNVNVVGISRGLTPPQSMAKSRLTPLTSGEFPGNGQVVDPAYGLRPGPTGRHRKNANRGSATPT